MGPNLTPPVVVRHAFVGGLVRAVRTYDLPFCVCAGLRLCQSVDSVPEEHRPRGRLYRAARFGLALASLFGGPSSAHLGATKMLAGPLPSFYSPTAALCRPFVPLWKKLEAGGWQFGEHRRKWPSQVLEDPRCVGSTARKWPSPLFCLLNSDLHFLLDGYYKEKADLEVCFNCQFLFVSVPICFSSCLSQFLSISVPFYFSSCYLSVKWAPDTRDAVPKFEQVYKKKKNINSQKKDTPIH